METFSLDPQIKLAEESAWLLLTVSCFEATNFVFNITNENNNFSISIAGFWVIERSEEIVDKLIKLLKLRSENDFELHIKDFEKNGSVLEMLGPNPNNPKNKILLFGAQIGSLNDLDTRKNEIFSDLKKIKCHDPEDMVYIMELSYDEAVDVLDVKFFAGSTKGYT